MLLLFTLKSGDAPAECQAWQLINVKLPVVARLALKGTNSVKYLKQDYKKAEK